MGVSSIDKSLAQSVDRIAGNVRTHGYVSLYNEVTAVTLAIKFINDMKELKRARAEDERDFEELNRMLENEDFSQYTKEQVLYRLNAVVAAIDEKMILDSKAILYAARLEDLVKKTIEYEVDQLLVNMDNL